MNFKPIGFLSVACLIGAVTLFPNLVQAQDAKVKTAMELLESKANKLGPPKIEWDRYCGWQASPGNLFWFYKDEQQFRFGR